MNTWRKYCRWQDRLNNRWLIRQSRSWSKNDAVVSYEDLYE